jgi:hypothetical protein
MKIFLLFIRHLTNLSLAWFDPIRPQDCIVADQSSALLACDLCGESQMSMSDVGKKWREGHFGGAVKGLMGWDVVMRQLAGGTHKPFLTSFAIAFSLCTTQYHAVSPFLPHGCTSSVPMIRHQNTQRV